MQHKKRNKVYKWVLIILVIGFLGLLLIRFTIYPISNIIKYGFSVFEDPYLSLSTDKGDYSQGETVTISIFSNLAKNISYIEFRGCGLTIKEFDKASEEPGKVYDGIVLKTSYTTSGIYDCINLGSSLKDFGVKTIKWQQDTCSLKNKSKAKPGKYIIAYSCGYEDLRGSSWEGILHLSVYNSTIIEIK
jgi:hypothetical protein